MYFLKIRALSFISQHYQSKIKYWNYKLQVQIAFTWVLKVLKIKNVWVSVLYWSVNSQSTSLQCVAMGHCELVDLLFVLFCFYFLGKISKCQYNALILMEFLSSTLPQYKFDGATATCSRLSRVVLIFDHEYYWHCSPLMTCD